MKTNILAAAVLIACFSAFSPAIAQTSSTQGGPGGGYATSNQPKDRGQNTMNGAETSGGPGMSAKKHGTGINGIGGMGNQSGFKGSPVGNEKSSATDPTSTATQGGGSSPLTTGEGMKQPSKTAR